MKKGTKRYKGWCDGCDRQIVAGGKKCKVCGKRMPKKLEKNLRTLISEVR